MANITQAVSQHLFSEPENMVYSVLDGASVPNLFDRLHENEPEYACLYRGELKPDLAETAPYLVRLSPDTPFTEWVLSEGWGNHWGIFASAPVELEDLRKHFRKFLMVKTSEGKQVYFRYYDPRVLRVYLPTCNAEETKLLFGPVTRYCCEDEKPKTFLSFRVNQNASRKELIQLT